MTNSWLTDTPEATETNSLVPRTLFLAPVSAIVFLRRSSSPPFCCDFWGARWIWSHDFWFGLGFCHSRLFPGRPNLTAAAAAATTITI
jgi:hypothetical protein